MAKRRVSDTECLYKDDHIKRMESIEKSVGEIKDRIYNGMGSEIRREVNSELAELRKDFKDENGGTRRLIIGILVTLLLALAGIIIEGRFSSRQSSVENDRNYKAILELESRFNEHVRETVHE